MNAVVPMKTASNSVLVRMGERFGVEPEKMLSTLKATAFKGDVSNEQMMALLVVADQYGLNPWTKEIFAFPDRNNGVVPVVGVDGWSRIINSNPQFDGMDFVDGPVDAQQIPEWIECKIYRKDRAHPICAKEYFAEVRRDVGPWKSHPRRMLRHKAMIQAARMAFGFAGIYDPDEGERIIEAERPTRVDPRGDLSNVDYALRDQHVAALTDLFAEYGNDEPVCAEKLREYVAEHLNPYPELYFTVNDKLAKDGIITKANLRKLMSLGLEVGRQK
jgi:phage recombination protein Bet